MSALVFARIDLILQVLLSGKEPGDTKRTSSIIIEDLLDDFLYIEGVLTVLTIIRFYIL